MKKSNTKIIAAKRIAVAVAAVCATMAMPAFAADDIKNLMDLLLKKGVITQQEYDQNIKAAEDAAENKAFKEKRLDDDVAKANKFIEKNAKAGSVKENGFGFKSADGKSEINLTGRMHVDARMFNSDFANSTNDTNVGTVKFGDQFEMRRARIGFNGKFNNDFTFEVVANAVGSTDIVDTAWVNYGFTPALQVRVGKFKQQFNLEELTSSNNIDFVERSYINQFAPAKKIGAMIHGIPMEGTTYGLSLFQEGSSNVAATGNLQTSARLTANIAKLADIKDSVIHLGLAGTSGKYDVVAASGSSATYMNIRNEQRGADAIYKLTGTAATGVASIVDKSLVGVEAAYAYGPFKMQSEYATLKLKADYLGATAADAEAKLWYVSALYNITGEKWSDAYKDGVFGSIKPLSHFDAKNGGTGGLQIGARYSQYDITKTTGTASTTATSPKGTTATVGLTWFVNSNMRFMLDHSMTRLGNDITLVTGATGNKESVTTLRTQYNF